MAAVATNLSSISLSVNPSLEIGPLNLNFPYVIVCSLVLCQEALISNLRRSIIVDKARSIDSGIDSDKQETKGKK
jgi:hypothetical protein